MQCAQPSDAFSIHEKADGAQHYKLLLLYSVRRLVLCQVDFLLITCLVFMFKFFPLFACVSFSWGGARVRALFACVSFSWDGARVRPCLCGGYRWASGMFLVCSITHPLYTWRRDPASPRAPHMLVLLASLPWGSPASTYLGWNSRQTATARNRISKSFWGPESGVLTMSRALTAEPSP